MWLYVCRQIDLESFQSYVNKQGCEDIAGVLSVGGKTEFDLVVFHVVGAVGYYSNFMLRAGCMWLTM